MDKGHIEIFENPDGRFHLDVRFDNETVWLNQQQIADLFDRDRTVISKHIKSIFKDGELSKNRVCANFAHTGSDGKSYQVEYFNLDVIISVGYRVRSYVGTIFRQWATSRLNELLIRGVVINQRRLDELQTTISEVKKQLLESEYQSMQGEGLLDTIIDYAKSFQLLSQFDSNMFNEPDLKYEFHYELNEQEALQEIARLKKRLIESGEASELFGNQKDKSFGGILGSVLQTFDRVYLYPTVEEQAANLLYLIIKNHPFSDGNKRIGALMFVWFLQKNRHHLKKSGELKINDNALVILALLIAQSSPNDKDVMIQLIIQLIQNSH